MGSVNNWSLNGIFEERFGYNNGLISPVGLPWLKLIPAKEARELNPLGAFTSEPSWGTKTVDALYFTGLNTAIKTPNTKNMAVLFKTNFRLFQRLPNSAITSMLSSFAASYCFGFVFML